MFTLDRYYLLDESIVESNLSQKVERAGDKPISDGITMENSGNVYITSITDNSIGVTQSTGQYRKLIKRKDLAWPDGMAVGPDNYIYVTINQGGIPL